MDNYRAVQLTMPNMAKRLERINQAKERDRAGIAGVEISV